VCGSGLFPLVKERAPQIVEDLQARGTYNADLDELGGEDTYHLLKHVKNHVDEYASYLGVAGKVLRPAVEWMSEQRNAWAHSHRTKTGEAVWKDEQVRRTFKKARDLLWALEDPYMEANLLQLANNFETHKILRESRLAEIGIQRDASVHPEAHQSSSSNTAAPEGQEEDQVQALVEEAAALPEVEVELDLSLISRTETKIGELQSQLQTLAQGKRFAEMEAVQTECGAQKEIFEAVAEKIRSAPLLLQDHAR
jgi:hypothetical protein